METSLQARQLMRGLCYRTIAEVRQRQRQQQQQSQQQQGIETPISGLASPAFSDDDAASLPAVDSSPGSRKQRSKGMLPFGGFIGHLLESDNPIVGRQFTDLEVGLREIGLPQGHWHAAADQECRVCMANVSIMC